MYKKISVIAIVAAVLGVYVFWPRGGNPPGMGPGGMGMMPPPSVTLLTLQNAPLVLSDEFPARIVPYNVAEIRPQVSGIITERLFEEGRAVKRGQPLYQIDPRPYQADLESAKAALARANANAVAATARLNRLRGLVKMGAVSKQEFDDASASATQARAEVSVANASLKRAKLNLDYTRVYAPIAGQIGKSSVTRGALVSAGQPAALAQVTQLDPVYADMNPSLAELTALRARFAKHPPTRVVLIGEGGQEYPQPGKLQFADATVDASTGSVLLRALFPNPDGVLFPGSFVRVRIESQTGEGLLVPQKSAVRGPDGSLNVWIVGPENKAMMKPFVARRTQGESWLVESGIAPGEQIIGEGIAKLMPGMVVNAAPPGGNAEPRVSGKP